MANSGDGEFPLWKLHQNYPLFTDDILNFMAQIRPTAAEIMAKAAADQKEPDTPPLPPPPSEAAAADVDYWGSTAGPSSYNFPGETSRRDQGHENFETQNPDHGGGGGYSRELSITPELDTFQPISCSCCLVLREIVHTNGWY